MKESASRSAEGVSIFPGRLPRCPKHGVDMLRIGRVEREVDGARVFVLVENLLPRAPAVERAEDSSLRIGSVGMSQNRGEDAIRVFRVDEERRNLPPVREPEVSPG